MSSMCASEGLFMFQCTPALSIFSISDTVLQLFSYHHIYIRQCLAIDWPRYAFNLRLSQPVRGNRATTKDAAVIADDPRAFAQLPVSFSQEERL